VDTPTRRHAGIGGARVPVVASEQSACAQAVGADVASGADVEVITLQLVVRVEAVARLGIAVIIGAEVPIIADVGPVVVAAGVIRKLVVAAQCRMAQILGAGVAVFTHQGLGTCHTLVLDAEVSYRTKVVIVTRQSVQSNVLTALGGAGVRCTRVSVVTALSRVGGAEPRYTYSMGSTTIGRRAGRAREGHIDATRHHIARILSTWVIVVATGSNALSRLAYPGPTNAALGTCVAVIAGGAIFYLAKTRRIIRRAVEARVVRRRIAHLQADAVGQAESFHYRVDAVPGTVTFVLSAGTIVVASIGCPAGTLSLGIERLSEGAGIRVGAGLGTNLGLLHGIAADRVGSPQIGLPGTVLLQSPILLDISIAHKPRPRCNAAS